MDIAAILTIANLGAALVEKGITTAQEFQSTAVESTGLSDEELNQLEQLVIDDAARRKLQSDIDAVA